MHAIRASARHSRAIHATAELLSKLRVESIFVGSVARSIWLGEEIERGSIDALVLMNAPQKQQVAMMASHRGYRVEREEIEQAEELDLVPLNFIDPDGDVRVHVLLASNALYGRMVSSGMSSLDANIRVPRVEDLALLVLLSDDHEAVETLRALPEFDRNAFDERLFAIGLGAQVAR